MPAIKSPEFIQYQTVCQALEEGEQVTQADWDAAKATATAKKLRAPKALPSQIIKTPAPAKAPTKAAKTASKPAAATKATKAPAAPKAAKPAAEKAPKAEKGPCSLADCSKPAKTHGKCHTHYVIAWRAANPEKLAAAKVRAAERKAAAAAAAPAA